ncbi:MAG: penicillin-binding protein 2 [Nitrospiraceae bacterium]|nr:MAG: penicillin-binding protein 2 [Nitrospiraceae bacterium]
MIKRRTRQKVESRKLWDEDLTRAPLEGSRKRALIIITVILFGFGVILFRLVDLMVLDHEKLSERAAQQYIREKTLTPQRGVIWDRKMREMATNIETDSLYVVPARIRDTRNLSSALAPIIKVSAGELEGVIHKKKDKGFAWLARRMDLETSRRLGELRAPFKEGEIGFVTEPKRYYPKGQTASHILGFSNIDDKGIAGVELVYDEYLKGEVKSVSVGMDAKGRSLASDIKETVPGNNIILTLDEGLQYIVERELNAAMEERKAKAAVAIMMDPMTGEILALANRPTYDPNFPAAAGGEEKRNRAITDLYEPGSTMKSVLASAALEEKAVRPGDLFDASRGAITVGGKTIHDVHRHGVLNFQEVIQKSSNVGAVKIGMRLGAAKYYEYLKKFGYGEKSGIDFPGEIKGILRNVKNWSGTSLAAMSIGQEIGVTPLQMLRAYSAIANGGVLMKPYIVSEIISPDGKVIKKNSPKEERRVISQTTSATLRGILKTVVEEGGTAQKASVKGNFVAGKTGTAQIFDPKTGRYSKNRFVSSFVGFAPADDPRVALIVVIYEPQGATYGGLVAAPVFKNIIEHTFTYLDVPMETEENRIYLVSK